MNKYSVAKLPGDLLIETAKKHRKLRKFLQLTQVELAKKSGVSYGTIKRFEQTGKISFESLLRLAHVLGRLGDFEPVFSITEDFKAVEKLFSDKTRE